MYFGRGPIRRFVDERVKIPVVLALSVFSSVVPEPTKENIGQENARIFANACLLIDIRDEFFRYETNKFRMPALKGVFNFAIYLYVCDGYYQQRIDWVMEKLFQIQALWQPRLKNTPDPHYWSEFIQGYND